MPVPAKTVPVTADQLTIVPANEASEAEIDLMWSGRRKKESSQPSLWDGTDDAEAPEEFRGIGIRIEDDVLVTAHGHDVMTAAIPKSVADVETLTTSAG